MALRFRRGRRADWAEIQRVTETAFGTKPGHFRRAYRHAYPGPEAAERFLVCEEDGRILGAVNRTPYPMRLGGVRLAAVGIGGVCALPEARGRGVMSGMLRMAEDLSREEGALLGVLWGDRKRYGRFGYETAGCQSTLTLTLRYLSDAPAVRLRRLGPQDAAAVLRLHRASPASVDRCLEWQRLLLRRSLYGAWGNAEGGLRVYLAAFREQPEKLAELGGDPRLFAGTVRAFAEGRRLERVEARAVETGGPWSALARRAVSVTCGHAGYVAIYDFGRFLDAAAPLFARGFNAFGVEPPLLVVHRGLRRAWELVPRKAACAVREVPVRRGRGASSRTARLELDALSWVRVFFPPPGGPQLPREADPRLLAALRLPLRIPPWETV